MLKNITIQKKLIISFSLLLFLFFIYVLYSLFSLNKTLHGYKDYREMAKDTVLASRVQANMLMLQVSIEKFLKEPSSDILKSIDSYYDKTTYFMNLATIEIKNPI